LTPVDPAELPGMEFDWLATDDAGHLAQMLSSGHGRVPDTALSSEEDLFALHLWLDEQPLSEALSIPEGTFQALLAQPQRRGLYVYDAQPAAGDAPDAARSDTYILLAAPTTPSPWNTCRKRSAPSSRTSPATSVASTPSPSKASDRPADVACTRTAMTEGRPGHHSSWAAFRFLLELSSAAEASRCCGGTPSAWCSRCWGP